MFVLNGFFVCVAKVTEIASRIFTKRELDCKARDITFIEEREKDPEKLKGAKKFWNVLGGDHGDEIRGMTNTLQLKSRCN